MIEMLCNEITNLFVLNEKKDQTKVREKVSKLAFIASEYYILSAEQLEALFNLERKVRNATGTNRIYIEEKVFRILDENAQYCCFDMEDDDEYLSLDKDLLKGEMDSEIREIYIAVQLLKNFVDEVVAFKRPRDNFSSKRKALALNLLATLSETYDIPEAFDLCLQFLKSRNKTLILGAIEYQDTYLRYRGGLLDSEIITLLEKVVKQTKDRSVATTALNLQVSSGGISEFHALHEIDRWKEKNGRW